MNIGSIFVLLHSFLWGLFPVVSVYLLSQVSSLSLMLYSSFVTTVFFFCFLGIQKKWDEIFHAKAWKYIFGLAIFNSIFFYGLVLWGMQYTTANNAGVLMLCEILFSFLLIHIIQKTPVQTYELIGAFSILLGLIIFKNPTSFSWNFGDTLIVLATTLAPIGNMFTQKARNEVSASMVLFGRNAITLVFCVVLLVLLPPYFSFPSLSLENNSFFLLLLFHGVVLLGIAKIFWVDSLQHISIPSAITLNSIYPVFTLFFSFLLFSTPPTWYQIIGLFPIIFGVYFITKN